MQASGGGEPADPVRARILSGGRNKTLTSLGGTLDEAAICAALEGINAKFCTPPLPDTEVRKIVASVARYEPSATRPSPAQEDQTLNAPPPQAEAATNSLLAGRVDLRRAIEHGIEPPVEIEPGLVLKGMKPGSDNHESLESTLGKPETANFHELS